MNLSNRAAFPMRTRFVPKMEHCKLLNVLIRDYAKRCDIVEE